MLVHGNRYLLHLIIARAQQTEGFTTQYIGAAEITTFVSEIFTEVWESVYASMEEHFSESYPAHIFKNVGRLKDLES